MVTLNLVAASRARANIKFSLAVADYTSKTHNPEPMWIDVDSRNGLADRVLKYITEGREVAINGSFPCLHTPRNQLLKSAAETPCGEALRIQPLWSKAQVKVGEVKTTAPKKSEAA